MHSHSENDAAAVAKSGAYQGWDTMGPSYLVDAPSSEFDVSHVSANL
jgi:hypothetical protein